MISLMIMYEDESVNIRYGDDSSLHLSPCGSEFVLEKSPTTSAYPLQSGEKVRQRTRFTTSNYKDLMLGALEFRNKYATQPYLPGELIPEGQRTVCCVDSKVEWPAWDSSNAEGGSNGEANVHSVDGRASLLLAPSGEEFFVGFMCRLSHEKHHSPESQETDGSVTEQALPDPRPSGSQTPFQQSNACANQPEPGERYQSTRVIQHHSVSAFPPMWSYPLSLALQRWRTLCPAEGNKEAAEGNKEDSRRHQTERIETTANTYKGERRSNLPKSLPIRCYSPHLHWDALVQAKQEVEPHLPTELVKVLCCQGVIYRIVDGAIPVVEVSPGHGSVIRSNGALASYFTHHRAGPGLVKDVTYHLSSLPPDTPGQAYSVSSVVSRASRILNCYNQARHSLKLHLTPSCLNKDISPETESFVQDEPIPESGYVNTPEMAQSRPNCVAEELAKIRRFNFLLETNHLLGALMGSTGVGCSSSGSIEKASHLMPLDESNITEALQRTSRAIQDIDKLISATAPTRDTAS